MEPLTLLTSIVAPLVRDNVDTDTMIPASYFRSLHTDQGTGLFAHWRYRPDGTDNPDFVLNQTAFRKSRILLSGANFACGSSRENAVWALERFGIRCVLALSFSDIFTENCFKNGVLPIALPADDHQYMVEQTAGGRHCTATVDVAARTIACAGGRTVAFELNARKRDILLTGADDIVATLRQRDAIAAFRAAQDERAPWLAS